MEFQNQHANGVALVTGASGSIGSAVVRRLFEKGWKTAGIDLRKNSAELALQVDVTDRVAMVEAVTETNNRLGPIALLVAAAGTYESVAAGQMTPDRWRRMLDVWLGGTRNACAAVLPQMQKIARGSAIALSAGPVSNTDGDAYYSAVTGTITGFIKSLSIEMAAFGICMNCIASEHPVDTERVAATVVFLAEAGNYYTGHVFCPCAAGRLAKEVI